MENAFPRSWCLFNNVIKSTVAAMWYFTHESVRNMQQCWRKGSKVNWHNVSDWRFTPYLYVWLYMRKKNLLCKQFQLWNYDKFLLITVSSGIECTINSLCAHNFRINSENTHNCFFFFGSPFDSTEFIENSRREKSVRNKVWVSRSTLTTSCLNMFQLTKNNMWIADIMLSIASMWIHDSDSYWTYKLTASHFFRWFC